MSPTLQNNDVLGQKKSFQPTISTSAFLVLNGHFVMFSMVVLSNAGHSKASECAHYVNCCFSSLTGKSILAESVPVHIARQAK
jgi:hypothetical protein